MHTTTSTTNSGNEMVSHFPVKFLEKLGGPEVQVPQDLVLSTIGDGRSEIILDYGRAEGGVPFFETSSVASEGKSVSIEVIYSETSSGIETAVGEQ
jgi:hypothetical protein